MKWRVHFEILLRSGFAARSREPPGRETEQTRDWITGRLFAFDDSFGEALSGVDVGRDALVAMAAVARAHMHTAVEFRIVVLEELQTIPAIWIVSAGHTEIGAQTTRFNLHQRPAQNHGAIQTAIALP